MALGSSLYQQLSENNLIIPYLENAFNSDQWPDEINVPMKQKDYSNNDWFFPSSHAVPDARWLYYQLHPDHRNNVLPRKNTTSDKLAMLFGVFLHTVVQEKMLISGLLEKQHIEVPLRDEEIHARGRADIIFPNHPQKKKDIVVDIKTTATENYNRLIKPTSSHKLQLLCYMKWYEILTGQAMDEGIILVIEAGRPFRQKEFRVHRDDEAMKALYDKWNYVRHCISINSPPEAKCCALNSDSMNKCNAREICLETY